MECIYVRLVIASVNVEHRFAHALGPLHGRRLALVAALLAKHLSVVLSRQKIGGGQCLVGARQQRWHKLCVHGSRRLGREHGPLETGGIGVFGADAGGNRRGWVELGRHGPAEARGRARGLVSGDRGVQFYHATVAGSRSGASVGKHRVGSQVFPSKSDKLLHEVQEAQILVEVLCLEQRGRTLEHLDEQGKRLVVSVVVDDLHVSLSSHVGQKLMGGESRRGVENKSSKHHAQKSDFRRRVVEVDVGVELN